MRLNKKRYSHNVEEEVTSASLGVQCGLESRYLGGSDPRACCTSSVVRKAAHGSQLECGNHSPEDCSPYNSHVLKAATSRIALTLQ